jgi:hypothetical protein
MNNILNGWGDACLWVGLPSVLWQTEVLLARAIDGELQLRLAHSKGPHFLSYAIGFKFAASKNIARIVRPEVGQIRLHLHGSQNNAPYGG